MTAEKTEHSTQLEVHDNYNFEQEPEQEVVEIEEVEQKLLDIEVVYALPDEQRVFALQVSEQTTVEEAIEQSGVLQAYSDIELGQQAIGIFSKQTKLDATLRQHDRIEIYRPLLGEPREIRKQRAKLGTLKRFKD